MFFLLFVGMGDEATGWRGVLALRHPERAGERRDWVLGRMEELGWAAPEEAAAAEWQEEVA